jgi:hypothetical protein
MSVEGYRKEQNGRDPKEDGDERFIMIYTIQIVK